VYGDRGRRGHAVELDLADLGGERAGHLVDCDDARDLGGAMDREKDEEITGYDADGNPVYGDREIKLPNGRRRRRKA
jgi:hypothetical protein